jgi:DNA-binding NtrC family response regulator
MARLSEYRWPGNVRELKHLVERAVILYDGNTIHFSGFDPAPPPEAPKEETELLPLNDFEKSYIEKVLQAVCWKLSGPNSASAVLRVKPTTLLYRMKKLGIRKPSIRSSCGQPERPTRF